MYTIRIVASSILKLFKEYLEPVIIKRFNWESVILLLVQGKVVWNGDIIEELQFPF